MYLKNSHTHNSLINKAAGRSWNTDQSLKLKSVFSIQIFTMFMVILTFLEYSEKFNVWMDLYYYSILLYITYHKIICADKIG